MEWSRLVLELNGQVHAMLKQMMLIQRQANADWNLVTETHAQAVASLVPGSPKLVVVNTDETRNGATSLYFWSGDELLLQPTAFTPTEQERMASAPIIGTIAELRNSNFTDVEAFIVTDLGLEGMFFKLPTVTGIIDDGISGVVSAAGIEYKRHYNNFTYSGPSFKEVPVVQLTVGTALSKQVNLRDYLNPHPRPNSVVIKSVLNAGNYGGIAFNYSGGVLTISGNPTRGLEQGHVIVVVEDYDKNIGMLFLPIFLTGGTLFDGIPDWIKQAGNAGTLASQPINDFTVKSGLFYTPAAKEVDGWPVNAGPATLVRVLGGLDPKQYGSDTAVVENGDTYTRTLNQATGNSNWRLVASGGGGGGSAISMEPTFQNLPTLQFPIGIDTVRTVAFADYKVSNHPVSQLSIKVVSKPDFVSKIQFNGLNMLVTAKAENNSPAYIGVEITDSVTKQSRTESILIDNIGAPTVRVTVTNPGEIVATVNADGSTTLQAPAKWDTRVDVPHLHDGIYMLIVGGGPSGNAVNKANTPGAFAQVVETSSAFYRIFADTDGSAYPPGDYQFVVKTFYHGVEMYNGVFKFKLTAAPVEPEPEPGTGTVTNQYWDETTTASKVGDLLVNNTSSYPMKQKWDIKTVVANLSHNAYWFQMTGAAGTVLAESQSPWTTVDTTSNATYEWFPGGSISNLTPQVFSVRVKFAKNGAVVHDKTTSFTLTSLTSPGLIGDPILYNVDTGADLGFVGADGLASFPLPTKWDVKWKYALVNHDYWRFEMFRKSGTSWLSEHFYEQTATATAQEKLRMLFNGDGNLFYESSGHQYRAGTWKAVLVLKLGGRAGAIVATDERIFTLTSSGTPPEETLSDIYFMPVVNGQAQPTINIPKLSGEIALPEVGTWDLGYKRTNSTLYRAEVSIARYVDGAYVPCDMGPAGPYSNGPNGADKWYGWAWTENDFFTKIFSDAMGVGRSGKYYTNGINSGNLTVPNQFFKVTVTEKNSTGGIIKTRVAIFKFVTSGDPGNPDPGNPGNPGTPGDIPAYSVAPKELFDIQNSNGVYSDITPGDFVEGNTRYRNWNGRKYKAFYYLNEVPLSDNGKASGNPINFKDIKIPNGIMLGIRKIYADVNWPGGATSSFETLRARGWDVWLHANENPAADGNLLFKTCIQHITTNGGENLNHGNLIREQNPTWLDCNYYPTKFSKNAASHKTDKFNAVQQGPVDSSPAATLNGLVDAGVTHWWWEGMHMGGLYIGDWDTPATDLKTLRPAFMWSSHNVKGAVNRINPGDQITEAEAQTVANYMAIFDGAIYTDEFSEGGYPQFLSQREWIYQKFAARLQSQNKPNTLYGDYGYGSVNIRQYHYSVKDENKNWLNSYVVGLLSENGGAVLDATTQHVFTMQYCKYFSAYRGTVVGGYWAITGHPISDYVGEFPIEAMILINRTPNSPKLSFHTALMQSNASGFDVPYKANKNIKPNGTLYEEYPDAPMELMKFQGLFGSLLYDGVYFWDSNGAKPLNDVNAWITIGTLTDAFQVGVRWYAKLITTLAQAGGDIFCCDYIVDGQAWSSTTTERRISKKGTPRYNNLYFNHALRDRKGFAICIPGTKKAFIYCNFFIPCNKIETVIIKYNNVEYNIGQVAGGTIAQCYEP